MRSTLRESPTKQMVTIPFRSLLQTLRLKALLMRSLLRFCHKFKINSQAQKMKTKLMRKSKRMRMRQ